MAREARGGLCTRMHAGSPIAQTRLHGHTPKPAGTNRRDVGVVHGPEGVYPFGVCRVLDKGEPGT